MAEFVKVELPETSEFEVYLDIDGAAEESEKTVPSVEGAVEEDSEGKTGGTSLGSGEEQGRPLHNAKKWKPTVPRGIFTPSRTKDSDTSEEGEIDIDTPYEGKLFGQTKVKAERVEKEPSLLNRLLTYARSVNPMPNVAKKSTTQRPASMAGVAKKSTTPQRREVTSSVATKSTTPKPPTIKTASHVAKKSTTKQASQAATKLNTKGVKSNVLQVKFGPGKSGAKVALRRPVGPSQTSAGAFSTPPRTAPKTQKSSVPSIASSGKSSLLQSSRKIFTCYEKSDEQMNCPECAITIQQRSMRSHLKTVHDLSMKNCSRCRLSFTDLELFSEHYALHLQQEEDLSSGIQSSPAQLKVTRTQASSAQQEPSAVQTRQGETTVPKHSRASGRSTPSGSGTVNIHSSEGLSKTGKIAFPVKPKLPPKPRQPSPSKKRRQAAAGIRGPSTSRSSDSDSQSLSGERNLATRSGLSRQTQNISTSRKRPASPASSSGRSRSPNISRRESLRERRYSSSSLESDFSSLSDSQTASNYHRSSQKTAYRRGQTADSPTYVPPIKKLQVDADFITVTVSRRHLEEARVSLVSLETASQPYNCKTCLAAFHRALTCPSAFRRCTQQKPFKCTKCGTFFASSVKLRTHQEIGCDSILSEAVAVSASSVLRPIRTPSSTAQPAGNNVQDSTETNGLDSESLECHFCREKFQYPSMLARHVPYHTHKYSCGLCKKAYQEKNALMDHFQVMHDGRSRMLCRYCGIMFDKFSDLEHHLHGHKDGTVVACTVCGQKFSDSRQMRMHLKSEHGDPVSQVEHACKVCRKSFSSANQLSVHMKMSHRHQRSIVTKFLSCRICAKVFHAKKGLASHYRCRHGMSLPAALASMETKERTASDDVPRMKGTSSSVQNRPKVSGSRSDTVCQICGCKYSNRRNMLRHFKNAHGSAVVQDTPSSLQCKICKKKLSTLHGLKVHYKLRHKCSQPLKKTSSHKCNKCGKCFVLLSNLYQHTRIYHSKQPNKAGGVQQGSRAPKKPWPCSACGAGFILRKSMRMHLKRFHPELYMDERMGTRKCSKCEKPFSSKAKLQAHAAQCGSKPVKKNCDPRKLGKPTPCSMCEKTFLWKHNFFRHLEITHKLSKADIVYNFTKRGNQPSQPRSAQRRLFLCKVCKECFTDGRALKRHTQRRHTGMSGVVQCRYRSCQKTFSKNQYLFNHIKVCHPGLSPYRCWGCKAGFPSSEALFAHSCLPVAGDNWETSSSSQQDDISESGSSASQIPQAGQEYRYRCTTCGMGFNIAREWTKHMQEHTEDPGAEPSQYETWAGETKPGLNIFDIMSADGIFSCQVCQQMFDDEDALALHACAKPSDTSSKWPSVKTEFPKPAQSQPVQCNICQKLFSPHSIRKHMLRIHNMRIKMCKMCDQFFTNGKQFKEHLEFHKQQAAPSKGEGLDMTSTTVGSFTDDSATFFGCSNCGNLFDDADALQLHECVEESFEGSQLDDSAPTDKAEVVEEETADQTGILKEPNDSNVGVVEDANSMLVYQSMDQSGGERNIPPQADISEESLTETTEFEKNLPCQTDMFKGAPVKATESERTISSQADMSKDVPMVSTDIEKTLQSQAEVLEDLPVEETESEKTLPCQTDMSEDAPLEAAESEETLPCQMDMLEDATESGKTLYSQTDILEDAPVEATFTLPQEQGQSEHEEHERGEQTCEGDDVPEENCDEIHFNTKNTLSSSESAFQGSAEESTFQAEAGTEQNEESKTDKLAYSGGLQMGESAKDTDDPRLDAVLGDSEHPGISDALQEALPGMDSPDTKLSDHEKNTDVFAQTSALVGSRPVDRKDESSDPLQLEETSAFQSTVDAKGVDTDTRNKETLGGEQNEMSEYLDISKRHTDTLGQGPTGTIQKPCKEPKRFRSENLFEALQGNNLPFILGSDEVDGTRSKDLQQEQSFVTRDADGSGNSEDEICLIREDGTLTENKVTNTELDSEASAKEGETNTVDQPPQRKYEELSTSQGVNAHDTCDVAGVVGDLLKGREQEASGS